MRMTYRVCVVAVAVLGAMSTANAVEYDLVIRNGRVMDPETNFEPCATSASRMDGSP